MFADETRPYLQGARLTAWELIRDGIPTTLIADSMAGHSWPGARWTPWSWAPTASRPTATWPTRSAPTRVAVLARENGVPFYVAAPVSTFDLATPSGDGIPIEERSPEEVTHHGGRRLAPEGVAVRNPAFDVTPHRYVTAIVCERGVARPPYDREPARAGGAGGRSVKPVQLLAIETSCDETAAAVVEDGRRILSNVVSTAGRAPRALRRRGAGAGLAPSPREHRARSSRRPWPTPASISPTSTPWP